MLANILYVQHVPKLLPPAFSAMVELMMWRLAVAVVAMCAFCSPVLVNISVCSIASHKVKADPLEIRVADPFLLHAKEVSH